METVQAVCYGRERVSRNRLPALCLATLLIFVAFAAPAGGFDGIPGEVEVSPSTVLSDGGGEQSPDLGYGLKPKIVSTNTGILVAVFGEAVDASRQVYELRTGQVRPALDIFVRTCDGSQGPHFCSDPINWTPAVNVSRTALLSSADTAWQGYVFGAEPLRQPFYGDSEKATVFAAGKRVVISWVDKYCPGGEQRNVTYTALENLAGEALTWAGPDCAQDDLTWVEPFIGTLDTAGLSISLSELAIVNREIPFSCVYSVYSSNEGRNWSVARQLTTGIRDPKQDGNQGIGSGEWGIVWQEDPLGLQPGLAEGPGEGASGAKVSHGTDIWYSYALKGWSDQGQGYGIWSTPVRITDNLGGTGVTDNQAARIRDANGPVPPILIDKGSVGASRPILHITYDSQVDAAPTVVVLYEETKNSEGCLFGKYVRMHSFPFDAPGTANNPVGCIISDPLENARRPRLVMQSKPGSTGLRFAALWKQGLYDKGGPSDIILRMGFAGGADPSATGLRWQDLQPPVDPACQTSVFEEAVQLHPVPGFNISHESFAGGNLEANTDDNNLEDARGHRAVLRGDDLHVGYMYTPHQALALNTNQENYDFWLRRFDGAAWGPPRNLTNLDKSISVKEPRLMGTPGSNTAGDACPNPGDPASNPRPEYCQDQAVLFVAWGTETNVFANEIPEDLDIFVMRSSDKGVTFTEPRALPDVTPGAPSLEVQMRPTPAGNYAYGVWKEIGAAQDEVLTGSVIAIPFQGLIPSRLGLVRGGTWIRDANVNGSFDGCDIDDCTGPFGGIPGNIPVAGDWDGDGDLDPGLFRPVGQYAHWLIDRNGNGLWDGDPGGDTLLVWPYYPGDLPIVGDWDGDGLVDNLGVFRVREGTIYWRLDANGNSLWDRPAGGDIKHIWPYYPGDLPAVGDWNGDGLVDNLGVFRVRDGNVYWRLDANGNGIWDQPGGGDIKHIWPYYPGDLPVVGDWNEDGFMDNLGVFRARDGNVYWRLDANGNGVWDQPSGGDGNYIFGNPGDLPLVWH